jgi:hypothetical protein
MRDNEKCNISRMTRKYNNTEVEYCAAFYSCHTAPDTFLGVGTDK